MMHLVMCSRCGYDFWTPESEETIKSWEPHCIVDDGYDHLQTSPNTWRGVKTNRELVWSRWLIDGEVIAAVALPDLMDKSNSPLDKGPSWA